MGKAQRKGITMIHLINGFAEEWFPFMASATLQATILALVVLGTLWIGRRWSPALRYAFMMLALCKFVIPPMLSLPTGLFNRIDPQQWHSAGFQLSFPYLLWQQLSGFPGAMLSRSPIFYPKMPAGA